MTNNINNNNNNNNNNITLGNKTSCRHKRELYLAYKSSNNMDFKKGTTVYTVKFCLMYLWRQKEHIIITNFKIKQ